MGLTLSLNLTSQLLQPKLLDCFWSPVLIQTLSLTVSTFPSLSHISHPCSLPSSSWHEAPSLPFGMRALNGHPAVIKCSSRCDPGTQNPFQQKPRLRNRADITGKFGLGVQNEAGQRLIELCQENTLVIANTFFQQHKRRLHMDITRWPTTKSD